MESENISEINEQLTEIDKTYEVYQQEMKEKAHDDNMSLKSEDNRRREAILKCEKRKIKVQNCCSIPCCVLIRIFLIVIMILAAADMVCLRNDHIYWLLLLPAMVVIFDGIWLIWERNVFKAII
jgi:hypothetical protein